MLIKIISGTYGYRPYREDGTRHPAIVERKDRNSDPFEETEEVARELIEQGIAIAVTDEPEQKPEIETTEPDSNPTKPDTADPESEPEQDEPEEEMVYTTDMSLNELRAAMKAHGFTLKANMSKAAMVETLNGDVLPELTAQEVIEE